MEYNLFLVKCNNEECGHEFVTNSTSQARIPLPLSNGIYDSLAI